MTHCKGCNQSLPRPRQHWCAACMALRIAASKDRWKKRNRKHIQAYERAYKRQHRARYKAAERRKMYARVTGREP